LVDTPHRWQNAGAPALGAWLREMPEALENRRPIDLTTCNRAGKYLSTFPV